LASSLLDSARNENEIIKFLRRRDYKLVRELGQGSSGKTVLLHDEQIDQYFVCKKYLPHSKIHKAMLFDSFVNEIKLLHRLQHPNVVRVFNHYLYPEHFAGYILMEYVDGYDIESHVMLHREQLNDLFSQAVAGFSYIERSQVLYRDVRPGNLLVDKSGILKIIDLGFGKHVTGPEAFQKSIELNWWCPTPKEFVQNRYDFGTEIYFLGKLFEGIIAKLDPGEFRYSEEVERMCERDPDKRIQSFAEIERRVLSEQFVGADFTDEEITMYRNFSEALSSGIAAIENSAKYVDDVAQVRSQLKTLFRTFMLEAFVPDPSIVYRCFVTGGYRFYKKGLSVDVVEEFLKLLCSSGEAKGRIILANLHRRMDAIKRYSQFDNADDDVPF
jgi:eukaryotic-like serine/threonine-protein kinase